MGQCGIETAIEDALEINMLFVRICMKINFTYINTACLLDLMFSNLGVVHLF